MRSAACLPILILLASGCGKKATNPPAGDGGSTCPAPTVTFRNPQADQQVNGEVAVQLNVTSQCPIQEVDLSSGDTSIAKMTVPPFSTFWDTSMLENGNYRLTAVATDNSGTTGTASINISVRQPCMPGQPCPPTVRFLTPADGANVCGKIALYAQATATQGTPTVSLSADGNDIATLTQAPYLEQWDTSTLSPGMHTLEADATDSAGLTARYTINVNVKAPGQCAPQGPVVAFACPTPDPQGFVSCVTGMVELCAVADDSVPISSVTYQVNGLPLGGAPAAPQWSETWDTTQYSEGIYPVQAIASDQMGLSTTERRSFQVDRTPPMVALTSPMDGTMIPAGTSVSLAVDASDGTGCGVQSVAYQISGPASASETSGASPFSAAWDTTGQPPGSYTVTAIATDRAGLTTTSSPVSLVITPSP